MKNLKHYSLHRDTEGKTLLIFKPRKDVGFEFAPKNSSEYMGMNINKMVVINPSFVEKVLKKKVKRRLDLYLQFIVNMLDDEDTDPTGLREVLNDVERYKRIIMNKYRLYLDEKYINLLLKKIELLSNEIKMKLIYSREPIEKEIEHEQRRSR